MSAQTIMTKLEELKNRYLDKDGNHLLVGGLDSYLTPERFVALAEKYHFVKHKDFHIDDETILDEIKGYLEGDRMIAVAAWTKEGRVDLYLEHLEGKKATRETDEILTSIAEKVDSVLLDLNDQGEVTTVACSPDGRLIAFENRKTVRLWDVAQKRLVRELKGKMEWVYTVAFTPDSQILAAGCSDNIVYLWNISSGREIQQLQGPRPTQGQLTRAVFSVAFSPNGKFLASASENSIRLWEIPSGREIKRLEGHKSTVKCVAFSPDGQFLASGSLDQTMLLWEVKNGIEIRKMEGHKGSIDAIAFSPDGQLLVSGGRDKIIRLWKVETGQEIRKLEGHTDEIRSLSFSPNGKLVASGSNDQTIRLWEAASGQELRRLDGHSNYVRSIAFSLDGHFLVSGSFDKTVRLWTISKSNLQQFSKVNVPKSATELRSDKACFIATAVYGSTSAQQVVLLRKFRNEVLMKSTVGRQFIGFYYQVSPSIAKLVANRYIVKKIIRVLMEPILGLLKWRAVSN